MPQIRLDNTCRAGGFLNAKIFHICGMPWAATDSPLFKEFIDSGTPDADSMRQYLFGDAQGYNAIAGNKSAYDVQVFTILEPDVGSQTIGFADDKGLDVGPWSVSVRGRDCGFTFDSATDIQCWGLIGLNCQPVTTSIGAAWSVLGNNFTAGAGYAGTLRWPEDKDFGLSTFITANHSSGGSINSNGYLWMGSNCLVPTTVPSASGGLYSCGVKTCQFNSPNEDVRRSVNEQNIFVTNYPQDISGNTAYLYGVHMDTSVSPSDSNFILTDIPIRLRTGKVKANTTSDKDMVWKIQCGGATEQLKMKLAPERFTAQLSGYHFSGQTNTDIRPFQGYHVMGVEYLVDTSDGSVTRVSQFEYNITASYQRYTDTADILDDIVTTINGGSLDCTYAVSGDDIVIIPNLTYQTGTNRWNCALRGPAVYCCGVGFLEGKPDLWSPSPFIRTISQSLDPNSIPQWANIQSYTYTEENAGAEKTNFVDGFYVDSADLDGYFNTNNSSAMLRQQGDAELDGIYALERDNLGNTYTGIEIITPKRNPTKCTYFYQSYIDNLGGGKFDDYQWNDLKVQPAPRTGSSSYLLYYEPTSEITVQVGDKLSFGGPNGDINCNVVSVGSSSGLNYFTVKAIGNDGTYWSDAIAGMPSTMFWCGDLADRVGTDEQLKALINLSRAMLVSNTIPEEFNTEDRYSINECTTVESGNAVNILRQLTGDTSIDIGVPPSLITTSVRDLSDRESSFRPIIDWDTLEDLIDSSEINGVDYKLEIKSDNEQQSDNANKPIQDVDILSMIQGLCLTHGIGMVWQYSATHYSHWITFKPYFGEALAETVTQGRELTQSDVKKQDLTGRAGGQWIYNKLKGQYRRKENDVINLGFKMRDGRVAPAAMKEELQITDVLTRLPQNDTEQRDRMYRRFADYLKDFATVHYKQRLQLNLSAYARIAVGAGLAFDYDSILNREIGKRGTGLQSGKVHSITIDMSKGNPSIVADVTINTIKNLGIGPAMLVDSVVNTSGSLACSGLATSTTNNDFADPAGGLVDSALFDCWNYNAASGEVVARGCSCSDYAVVIFERGVERTTKGGAIGTHNAFPGTISVTTANLAAGTCTITIDSAKSAHFDSINSSNGSWVVKFDRLDSANTQSCQSQLYGYWGDSAGRVEDAAGVLQTAIVVGG